MDVKGNEQQCPKCNYVWKTKAKMMYITCPNCQRKFKREDKNE
jgi:predicted  nucleic acid-binding Zn-ribbon protein